MNRTHGKNYAWDLPHTCLFPYDKDCYNRLFVMSFLNHPDVAVGCFVWVVGWVGMAVVHSSPFPFWKVRGRFGSILWFCAWQPMVKSLKYCRGSLHADYTHGKGIVCVTPLTFVQCVLQHLLYLITKKIIVVTANNTAFL